MARQGQTGRTTRWTFRDEQAMRRFSKYLRELLDKAKAEKGLSLRDIARMSAKADGTDGVSYQAISRLANGMHEPTPRTLKALARGLRGYTTYDKLLTVAGVEDPTVDTTPFSDRVRALLVDEGLPAEAIEPVVGLLEYQLDRDAPKRRRKSS